jgi:surface protein
MSFMFNDATDFNQSLATFNTSNVTDMSYMFATNLYGNNNIFSVLGMQFNQPLTNFNMSKVVNNEGMFDGATQFTFPKPTIPIKEPAVKEMGSRDIVLGSNITSVASATSVASITPAASITPVASINKQFTISMNISINS